MNFEFVSAGKIIFGEGAAENLGTLAQGFGSQAFVVTGANSARAEFLLKFLHECKVKSTVFSVAGEPTIDLIRKGTQLARECDCRLVIGLGGGSVIDTGKAIASLLANGGDPLDYLEVVGQGKPIEKPSLPFIAVPTSAGTGAEVTKNAVLGFPEAGVKASLRSPFMLPAVALVDPRLTRSLSPRLTADTGLDALTQLIEPFVSKKANPLTDGFCREGLKLASHALVKAYRNGRDRQARHDMALASLFGGLALANAGLGAAHGFAAPIGGMFKAPHGAICARLLPLVMETNIRAMTARDPRNPSLLRYEETARILTSNPAATAGEGALWVAKLCSTLAVPGLGAWGISEKACMTLIEKAKNSSSMQGNPIPLTNAELGDILLKAL